VPNTCAERDFVQIWDIADKRVLHVYEGHREDVYSLDLSLDGRLIVSGSGDKTVRIWNMSNSNAPPMVCHAVPMFALTSKCGVGRL
jgi:WD40 repeat protein